MSFRHLAAAALAAGSLAAFAAPAEAQSPNGTWLTASGETRVRLGPCGANLCGTVVWVKNPGKDEKNENAGQRGRDLVGIQMVNMQPGSGGEWSGTLYDYTQGKTFTGKMKMDGADKISMSGCIAGGLICRSSTWTRAN